jgi:hypothetical protein
MAAMTALLVPTTPTHFIWIDGLGCEHFCAFKTYTLDPPTDITSAKKILASWQKSAQLIGRRDTYHLVESDSWTPSMFNYDPT